MSSHSVSFPSQSHDVSPERLFCTRVFSLQTGKIVYEMAKAKTYDQKIHLVFQASTEPFIDMLPYIVLFPVASIDSDVVEDVQEVWCVNQTGDDLNKVTQVFIDIHCVYDSIVPTLAGINKLCQHNFPNMNPAHSTVSIHCESTHWECNDILLPAQSSCDKNNPIANTVKMYPK